jgi:hypothetical protein
MKKILLSLMFMGAFSFAKAQVVLNEVYAFPNGTNNEFIELYNSGVGTQNLNCFTVLTYWSDGDGNKGWYVLDLPDTLIGPKGYFTLASDDPYAVQGKPDTVNAGVNWNDAGFRNGSTSNFKKYQVSGSSYTDVTTAAAVMDLLVIGDFYTGQNTLTLVFQNGVFINGFWAGGPTGTLPASITGMPDLTIDMQGACADFTINFSADDANVLTSDVGAVEFSNASGGTDNGYARKFDGKCGSWVKTSSQATHTPNKTNGSAAGQAGELITEQNVTCGSTAARGYVTFNITNVSGSVTVADDFPVEVQLYNDVNNNDTLDAGDLQINRDTVYTLTDGADTMQFHQSIVNLIIVYKTKRGCFDKVVNLVNSCIPLPVKFQSFTATRSNSSSVAVAWTTASEDNNKGFNVQKLVNGQWQTVGYVPSQALNGNSSAKLSYTYTDANSEKGITQYRIQQVDLDGHSKYTDIRAVRGDGSVSKLVVYPNPSSDGKVNVVFEDNSGMRDVQVSDMQGKIIRAFKGISNNILVIEKLTTGFYTIKVTNRTTNASSVQKVVVR